MTFDGAANFGRFATIAIVGTLIAVPGTGWWPMLSVLVALWFMLRMYNALERRDRRDRFSRRRPDHR